MKKIFLIFVFLLAVSSIRPFFLSGFFHMHDDTQVIRVYEMGKALKDGYFPVRWVKDLGYGYGYPIFNFYAPLSYYVGGFLDVIGFDSLHATKIMMILGIYLSAVSMFFLARNIWGDIGGAVSSIFYVLAPYHALDIYVRGDVAEFYAYAIIPFVLYGVFNYYKTLKSRYLVFGILSYASTILSHNLTALMFTPFLLISVFVVSSLLFKNRRIKEALLVFSIPIIGILISTWYWMPVFYEMKYTNVLSQVGGGADYRDHFVCLSQLWDSHWGFGGSAKGCTDGLSFKIGKIATFVTIMSLILALRFKKSKELLFIVLFSSNVLLSIFMTFSVSQFIWESLPGMAFFQYPWRFLALVSLFSSLLIGSLFAKPFIILKSKLVNNIFTAFLLVAALVFLNAKLFSPQYIYKASSEELTNNFNSKWVVSKISDEYLPKNFIKPNNYSETPSSYLSTDLPIKIHKEKTDEILATIFTKEKQRMITSIAYFPFWKVYVNKQEQHYSNEKGRISILLEKGSNDVNIKIVQTSIEKISNIISITSLITLLIGIILKRRLFLG